MFALTLIIGAFTATCLMLAGLPLLGSAMLVSIGVTAAVELATGDNDDE